MIEEFGRVLREQLRKDMNAYADDVAGGACQSFDEYKRSCGVIQGLAIAERYLLDLLEKVKKADE